VIAAQEYGVRVQTAGDEVRNDPSGLRPSIDIVPEIDFDRLLGFAQGLVLVDPSMDILQQVQASVNVPNSI
jgi:hypothetical protein